MIFLGTRQDTNNFQIIRYDENSLFASIWGLGGGGLLIRDIFSSFFIMNDVMMTSLLLLKIHLC